MSTSGTHPTTVGWFEIAATDPELDKQFYQGIFDWQFTSFGPGYYTITAPGASASMGALRRGSQDALWISVVCDDIASTIPRLETLGAKVFEDPARTAAGDLHAVITDVQGNKIGLFEPAAREYVRPAPAPNATAWFEIGTTDFEATRKFYEHAFGWAYERDEAAEGAVYYSVHPGGSKEPIGGTMDVTGMPNPADYAIPGLLVTDVADLLTRVEQAGGQRLMDPFADATGLIIGQFTDPFGNRWTAFAQP
ncbi:VOC family protein [Nocardia sp. NPDC051756]|uniref:VOC family protein n=1 Tax=Nocardia sp. NPDC051756 TaxID=3154751 RepID=UPI0034307729